MRLLQGKVHFKWTCALCGNRRFWHPSALHCSLKEHVHIMKSVWQNPSFSLSSADCRFNVDSLWFAMEEFEKTCFSCFCGEALSQYWVWWSASQLLFLFFSFFYFFATCCACVLLTINSVIYSFKCYSVTVACRNCSKDVISIEDINMKEVVPSLHRLGCIKVYSSMYIQCIRYDM